MSEQCRDYTSSARPSSSFSGDRGAAAPFPSSAGTRRTVTALHHRAVGNASPSRGDENGIEESAAAASAATAALIGEKGSGGEERSNSNNKRRRRNAAAIYVWPSMLINRIGICLWNAATKFSSSTVTLQTRIYHWKASSPRIINALLLLLLATAGWFFIVRTVLLPLPGYRSREQRDFRKFRFPSVDERIRLYLSDWYDPLCSNSSDKRMQQMVVRYAFHRHNDTDTDSRIQSGRQQSNDYFLAVTELPAPAAVATSTSSTNPRTFRIRTQVEVSVIFSYDPRQLLVCGSKKWPISPYCTESLSTMNAWWEKEKHVVGNSDNDNIPILLQFGDEDESKAYSMDKKGGGDPFEYNPRIPHIKKFRKAITAKEELEYLTGAISGTSSSSSSSSLLYSPGSCVSQDQTPQPQQRPPPGVLVRRDQRNSYYPILWKLNAKRHFRDLYLVPRNDRRWERKSDRAVFRGALTGVQVEPGIGIESAGYSALSSGALVDTCLRVPRCRLVYKYDRSEFVDAKLTKLMDLLPSTVNGVDILGPSLSLREMMKYKGIIVLEGNDVSSGAKWALLSQSVVLMPQPVYTSWAMEEMLEPWLHYIPLAPDLSDVEEKVRWMLHHDSESQRIAHRATLWILDLVFHPDAAGDDRLIQEEILRRYANHFRSSSTADPSQAGIGGK